MKLPSIQRCYLIGFIFAVASLTLAGYLQFAKGIMPCPLCQLQRLCMGLIGLLFLFAVLQRPKKQGIKRYGWAILVFAMLGAFLAGKQFMMQWTHTVIKASCGVSLDYMLQVLPFLDVLKLVLQGVGDCSRIEWNFIGLPLSGWTFIAFVFVGLLGVVQNLRLKKAS